MDDVSLFLLVFEPGVVLCVCELLCYFVICPGALLDPVHFFFHIVFVTQIARWFRMCLLTYRHCLSVHVLHLMGVSVSCDYRIF